MLSQIKLRIYQLSFTYDLDVVPLMKSSQVTHIQRFEASNQSLIEGTHPIGLLGLDWLVYTVDIPVMTPTSPPIILLVLNKSSNRI